MCMHVFNCVCIFKFLFSWEFLEFLIFYFEILNCEFGNFLTDDCLFHGGVNEFILL